MGCVCSGREGNDKSNAVESIIQAAEEMLEIGKLKTSEYDKGVTRFAINNKLSEKNFIHAYASLNLSTEFLKNDNSPLLRFYENFKEMNIYELRKLACLGIWLGNDDYKKKAFELFSNYDRDWSNKLDQAEIRCMLNDMIKINLAIVKFATLIYPYKTIILQSYTRKLRRSQEILKKYIIHLIFRGETVREIGLKEFLECFEDSTVKKLTSSESFRELLIECSELLDQATLNLD